MRLRNLHKALDHCVGKFVALVQIAVCHHISPASCRDYFHIFFADTSHRLSNHFLKLRLCILFFLGIHFGSTASSSPKRTRLLHPPTRSGTWGTRVIRFSDDCCVTWKRCLEEAPPLPTSLPWSRRNWTSRCVSYSRWIRVLVFPLCSSDSAVGPVEIP